MLRDGLAIDREGLEIERADVDVVPGANIPLSRLTEILSRVSPCVLCTVKAKAIASGICVRRHGTPFTEK